MQSLVESVDAGRTLGLDDKELELKRTGRSPTSRRLPLVRVGAAGDLTREGLRTPLSGSLPVSNLEVFQSELPLLTSNTSAKTSIHGRCRYDCKACKLNVLSIVGCEVPQLGALDFGHFGRLLPGVAEVSATLLPLAGRTILPMTLSAIAHSFMGPAYAKVLCTRLLE